MHIDSPHLGVRYRLPSLSPHKGGMHLDTRSLITNAHFKRYAEDDRAPLAQELHAALTSVSAERHSGLRLEYQPLVDIGSATLHGFEALLRWTTLSEQAISPVTAIDIATHFGLGELLDRWVVRSAIAQLAGWVRRCPDIVVSINLTHALLHHPDCAMVVESELSRHGAAARNFCVEVTETVLLDEVALINLRGLRNLGVRLALDDFGTGQSTLARLMDLQVDNVKLDRSFIMNRDLSAQDEAFLKAMVGMSTARGATTTIEGVSQPEHLDLARRIGCTYCQGFWYSKAVSAPRAADMLLLSVDEWAKAGRN